MLFYKDYLQHLKEDGRLESIYSNKKKTLNRPVRYAFEVAISLPDTFVIAFVKNGYIRNDIG